MVAWYHEGYRTNRQTMFCLSIAPILTVSCPIAPMELWARLHLDYAGPVQGKMILVMVDAHSKRIEAICTPNATSTAVIEELRTIFAQFGIPETVVTDNGTCFVSAEIEAFFKSNGIKHLISASHHPASVCIDSQERIEEDHSWYYAYSPCSSSPNLPPHSAIHYWNLSE